MSFRFRRRESLRDGCVRIVVEQIDRAIADVVGGDDDPHEAVHQVRKRCKKIRAVLRLIRPKFTNYRGENAWFRDAAQGLSAVRDAESIIECCAALRSRYADHPESGLLVALRERLVDRRFRIAHEERDLPAQLEELVDSLRKAKRRVADWRLEKGGFAGWNEGLSDVYSRGRDARREAAARPSPENFHEWRKQVKYHWYHARLLRRTWNGPMRAWQSELKRLSDLLGDDHDLAMLETTIADEPELFDAAADRRACAALIRARSGELRAAAQSLGRRIFAEKPRCLVRRWKTYWKVWRSKQSKSIDGAACGDVVGSAIRRPR